MELRKIIVAIACLLSQDLHIGSYSYVGYGFISRYHVGIRLVVLRNIIVAMAGQANISTLNSHRLVLSTQLLAVAFQGIIQAFDW